MRRFILIVLAALAVVVAKAEGVYVYVGVGVNDSVVASIDEEKDGRVINLLGKGDLAESEAHLLVVLKLPNGAIQQKEMWVDIRGGRGSVTPTYFDKTLPSATQFLSVQIDLATPQ